MIQVLEFGAQTAVHAEDLLIDQSCNGQTIEDITENSPESDRISAFALVIEAIDTVDLSTFVVAAQQEKVLGVLDFVAQEKANCFDRLLAAIDIVTKEQIVGLGRESAVLEDP